MKIISSIILALTAISASINVQAADFALKRAVITWNGGIVDDSAIGGKFTASGTMAVNGNVIQQNITFCDSGSCEKVVENGGGTIIDVAANTARITARTDDGTVGDLTILTLFPNIITLFVYDDGTVETHEWEPVN